MNEVGGLLMFILFINLIFLGYEMVFEYWKNFLIGGCFDYYNFLG